MKHLCECLDIGCPIHEGTSCRTIGHTWTLYRIDMEDVTGTRMCDPCSNDAMESGLFRTTSR